MLRFLFGGIPFSYESSDMGQLKQGLMLGFIIESSHWHRGPFKAVFFLNDSPRVPKGHQLSEPGRSTCFHPVPAEASVRTRVGLSHEHPLGAR